MFEYIHLKNFRSHEETKLDLDPGVNVFIGLSAAGKTNVMRGFDWVFENKPAADKVKPRSWDGFEDEVKVSVKTTEGYIVTRRKTASKNEYILEGPDIEKQVFSSFGQDIPREIKDILNISPINIQKQFAPAFLLSEKSGEVARQINKIAHLDGINKTTTYIEGQKREFANDVKTAEKRLVEHKENLEQYSDLDSLEDKVEALETKSNIFKGLKQEYSSLVMLIQNIKKNQTSLESKQEITKYADKVDGLIKRQESISAMNEEADSLYGLLESITKHEERIKDINTTLSVKGKVSTLEDLLNNIQSIEKKIKSLSEAIYSIKQTEEKAKQLKVITKHKDAMLDLEEREDKVIVLSDKIWSLKESTKNIKSLEDELKDIKDDKKELKKELESIMPDVCPLCEREM